MEAKIKEIENLSQEQFQEIIDKSSTLNEDEKTYWKDSFNIMNPDQVEFLLRWV